MEIGPWRMNDHGGLDVAEGGWEEYTNIVYGLSPIFDLSFVSGQADATYTTPYPVDQPAGTGYSYTSTDSFVHELSDVCSSHFTLRLG